MDVTSKDYNDVSALKDLLETRGWAVLKERVLADIADLQQFLDDIDNYSDRYGYLARIMAKQVYKSLLEMPEKLISEKTAVTKRTNFDPYK